MRLAFVPAWAVLVAATVLAISTELAANFPSLTGRIVDEANVIAPQARASLEMKLKDLEDKSGIQLVVATVSSLDGQEVEPYANSLFRAWKLGEKQKNNGVLLLVAPTNARSELRSVTASKAR